MAYTPPNYGGYERSKRDVDYKYSNDATTNAYGRFISQQRGSRQLGDLNRSFERSYPGYKAQFGRRGLLGGDVKSGTMRNAMSNYVGDYARTYGRGQQDVVQELQQYDLNQNRLNDWRSQSMADIEAQKANDIAAAADGILYLRELLGGL